MKCFEADQKTSIVNLKRNDFDFMSEIHVLQIRSLEGVVERPRLPVSLASKATLISGITLISVEFTFLCFDFFSSTYKLVEHLEFKTGNFHRNTD